MDHARAPFGRLAVLASAALLAVAACGGSAAQQPTATAVVSSAPSPEPSAPASAATPEATAGANADEVTVATSPTDGKYLAGKDGLTLYVFKKDTGSTSTCYDACATAWPPFTVGAGEPATAAADVTGTLATTTRTDGTLQVTYDGAPLYYFAGDRKAGDTNGQGLNGVWFMAAP
jgi:predicted lipoprotein with Yx(FWY)xxD motif